MGLGIAATVGTADYLSRFGIIVDQIVGKLSEQKSNTYGYNAQTGEYADFIDAGIVDPTKVVRVALQNAASVAGLLITTEAMITDRPKKAEKHRYGCA